MHLLSQLISSKYKLAFSFSLLTILIQVLGCANGDVKIITDQERVSLNLFEKADMIYLFKVRDFELVKEQLSKAEIAALNLAVKNAISSNRIVVANDSGESISGYRILFVVDKTCRRRAVLYSIKEEKIVVNQYDIGLVSKPNELDIPAIELKLNPDIMKIISDKECKLNDIEGDFLTRF